MIIFEPSRPFPAARRTAPAVAFDIRWEAWLARGRARRQRTRRRTVVWMPVLAAAAAGVGYAFLR